MALEDIQRSLEVPDLREQFLWQRRHDPEIPPLQHGVVAIVWVQVEVLGICRDQGAGVSEAFLELALPSDWSQREGVVVFLSPRVEAWVQSPGGGVLSVVRVVGVAHAGGGGGGSGEAGRRSGGHRERWGLRVGWSMIFSSALLRRAVTKMAQSLDMLGVTEVSWRRCSIVSVLTRDLTSVNI
ncbi:uncharacterized protein K489DRAFT_187734 [Dissoconium aciculare CBS 342.82]|uniref:Uncharacterized protein n=1 Tax=Dissoconium aciculare CBS 342.82 TaxID=1314786 RepID=A0A6J3MA10_9PEZI|nr:uncharacterized protein K489DRAFT_187734 [Dissoconium aciculare CBS 342.82]KAF1824683.1 hypothetical protein K489DRAFT_187734 [Dissoconium aciculare CBS 342.82]